MNTESAKIFEQLIGAPPGDLAQVLAWLLFGVVGIAVVLWLKAIATKRQQMADFDDNDMFVAMVRAFVFLIFMLLFFIST